MSDDLDLRLRTLRNLSWEESDRIEHPWYLDPTKTVTVIAYTRGDESGRICLLDGEPKWGHEWTVPDYPNNLGACAEVLAAIEARGWWWKAWSCDDHAVFMIYDDEEEYGPLSTNATGPLPAAICEAFCEAVEGRAG